MVNNKTEVIQKEIADIDQVLEWYRIGQAKSKNSHLAPYYRARISHLERRRAEFERQLSKANYSK